MMLGVTSGTNSAWSVICLSACAQRSAAVGALVLSAASAARMVASSRGLQNSDQLELPVECGEKFWQLARNWMNSDAAG